MKETKKVTIQVRLDEVTRDKFQKYCETAGTSVSDELRRFIMYRLREKQSRD